MAHAEEHVSGETEWRAWQEDDPAVESHAVALVAEQAAMRWAERFLPLGGTATVLVARADSGGSSRRFVVTARRAVDVVERYDAMPNGS